MTVTIADVIRTLIQEIASEQDIELPDDFGGDSVLLDSGLDSLAFAILVAGLEDELGYDPFVLMETPVYPRTLDEFIAVYDKFSEHRLT